MSKTEWLATLNDGDQVIVEQKRGVGRFQDVATLRLTPAYIFARCPGQQRTYKFRRSDGSRIGPDAVYERITLAPYDPETHLRICVMYMKIRLEEALRRFSTDQINALSSATCAILLHAVEELEGLLFQIIPPVEKEPAP